MKPVDLFTIGFTKTTAEGFFSRLQEAGVRTVIDVRLNNTSQLSGFAKARDLEFFLDRLGGIQYRHEPLLAPTDDILAGYRKKRLSWEEYEQRFLNLIRERHIEAQLDPDSLDGACLLCSEDKPHRCHRRLVAEYLRGEWDRPIEIAHL